MWQHRHAAVDGVISALLASVEDGDPRCNTFRYLIGNLQEFGRDQFEFFYYGFHPDPAGKNEPRLKRADNYPPALAMRATVDQIAFDLNAYGSVLTQRRMAQGDSPAAQKLVQTFSVTDRLAYAALYPALGRMNGRGQPTVLTYFQKSGFIRTIPYADVSLIGVPYTTVGEYASAGQLASELGNATDLLAIPHEVGHYVYRHALFSYPAGRIENGRILTIMNRMHQNKEVIQSKRIHIWLEEIFADVYGVYVAGPVMVRDFQDLLSDNDPAAFDPPGKNDQEDEHPHPAVRPFIYNHALRVLADHVDEDGDWLKDMAGEADDRWAAHLNKDQLKWAQKTLKPILPAVKAMVELLLLAAPASCTRMWTPPGTAYDDLYAAFYEQVVNGRVWAESGDCPEPDKTDPIPSYLWTRMRRDRIVDRNNGSKEIAPQTWKLIASMDGWAVHGPENNPVPVVD